MKCSRPSIVLALIIISFSLSLSRSAFAQESPDDEVMQTPSGLPFLISTVAMAAGGISTVAGFGITSTMVATQSNKDQEEVLQTYLNHNSVALQQDLFLGAGESITDLAQLFGVPEEDFSVFAAHLFEHRQELAALLAEGQVTEQETRYFVSVVSAGISALLPEG